MAAAKEVDNGTRCTGLVRRGKIMSVSKWNYDPERCDYDYCPGDCDFCHKSEEEYTVEEIVKSSQRAMREKNEIR